MKVLDLFSGLQGWSEPFSLREHDIFTIDNDANFEPDWCIDILKVDSDELTSRMGGKPDIILASPPCTTFSTMTMGRNWNKNGDIYTPKTEKARISLELVQKTVSLIEDLAPKFWVIENPRAILRKLGVFPADWERRTVWYCRYGEPFAKPTDLWGGFPPSWRPRPQCHNGNDDHVMAPRGSRTGIQGFGVLNKKEFPRERRGSLSNYYNQHRDIYKTKDKAALAALRAKIPVQLSLEICMCAEFDL